MTNQWENSLDFCFTLFLEKILFWFTGKLEYFSKVVQLS